MSDMSDDHFYQSQDIQRDYSFTSDNQDNTPDLRPADDKGHTTPKARPDGKLDDILAWPFDSSSQDNKSTCSPDVNGSIIKCAGENSFIAVKSSDSGIRSKSEELKKAECDDTQDYSQPDVPVSPLTLAKNVRVCLLMKYKVMPYRKVAVMRVHAFEIARDFMAAQARRPLKVDENRLEIDKKKLEMDLEKLENRLEMEFENKLEFENGLEMKLEMDKKKLEEKLKKLVDYPKKLEMDKEKIEKEFNKFGKNIQDFTKFKEGLKKYYEFKIFEEDHDHLEKSFKWYLKFDSPEEGCDQYKKLSEWYQEFKMPEENLVQFKKRIKSDHKFKISKEDLDQYNKLSEWYHEFKMRNLDYDQFKERMKSYEDYEMRKKDYDEFKYLLKDVKEFTRFICNDCFAERREAQFYKKGFSDLISLIKANQGTLGIEQKHIAISKLFDLPIQSAGYNKIFRCMENKMFLKAQKKRKEKSQKHEMMSESEDDGSEEQGADTPKKKMKNDRDLNDETCLAVLSCDKLFAYLVDIDELIDLFGFMNKETINGITILKNKFMDVLKFDL
jgi:hypothetical protein